MNNNDTHMKSDWTEAVRRKAQSATKQPPAGSWEAMAARLTKKQEPAPPKRAHVLPQRRWLLTAAAAAAVALVMSIGIKLAQQADVSHMSVSPSQEMPSLGMQTVAQTSASTESGKAARRLRRLHRRYRKVVTATEECDDSVNLGALYASATGGPGVPNRPMGQGDEDEAPSSSLNPWQNYSDHEYNAYRQMEDNARTLGDAGSLPDALAVGPHRWALGVNVSGLSVADRNQSITAADGSTLSYRHKMPLAIGLDVSRDFARGAVTATVGLTYTLLRTQVSSAAADVTKSMSTLSLPIGVRWNALRKTRFRAYVGAEVAPGLVVCLPSGVTCSDRFKLLGASGVLGAQYFVSPRVSLYAEPRVVFRTATLPMPTVQGVNDVDFNLQLGLKWHF